MNYMLILGKKAQFWHYNRFMNGILLSAGAYLSLYQLAIGDLLFLKLFLLPMCTFA